jgi:thiamine biosynthesis lipoprotein
MSLERPTRRRAIGILATAAGGVATALALQSQRAPAFEWHGSAMGTDAHILLHGASYVDARAAVEAAVAEIERLEGVLSLFRDDSEIWHLNRDGALAEFSSDIHRAMVLALHISQASSGLFDPTVQALWEAHVDWFRAAPDAGPPPDSRLAQARAAVDWRRIVVEPHQIRLGKGQRVTLNGIGQGYVTDRIADLLRARGFRHVLLDLGEQRALGPRADGSPWLIELAGTSPVTLFEEALATSESSGCVLGAGGAVHHLFDPRTGRSSDRWSRLTVRHRWAAVADGLSTALYAAAAEEIERIVSRMPGTAVWATDREGTVRQWASRHRDV